MTGAESLIDQELASIASTPKPTHLGASRETTPERALVHLVYLSVLDKRRGLPGADEAKVEGYIRTARGAGILEQEIEAAIAKAEATEP